MCDVQQIHAFRFIRPNSFLQDPMQKDSTNDMQMLRLTNERFSIPEVLFHPSDVAIDQMGVPAAVMDSILACPEETRPHLLANIVVVGGCARFAGMGTRLQNDIRALAPDDMDVNVTVGEKYMQCNVCLCVRRR